VAGFCEYGDEPAGSGATQLVSFAPKGLRICLKSGLLSLDVSWLKFCTHLSSVYV
jgi:hypothetical protein